MFDVLNQIRVLYPQGFGLRQPSAAFRPHGWRYQSARGLAHSKTLTRVAMTLK
jgi:hypothetical protein